MLLFVSPGGAIEESKRENVQVKSGKQLYQEACAACHGGDGVGLGASTLGFAVPLPDFSDCNFAPREPNGDWYFVVAEGGPARVFDKIMPAFGDALSKEEILKILDHTRNFCQDKNWARGELNLPRALVTTKAYPEDEIVWAASVNLDNENVIANELIYEQRFGARNQFELIVPFGWSEQVSGPDGDTEWTSSVGDIGLALKRVMFHSLESGSIVSLGAELFLPTGDEDEGFGKDTTVFEPYISYGQLLPADFSFQFQAGAALPFDTDRANEEIFWRGVLGKTFVLGRYGHAITPMVEILGSKELVSEADTNWDAVPQIQIPLNRRQHVRLGIGAQLPLNNTDQREETYQVYVLWDWFDGGLFEGW
ncbi:MAG: c-type cytochrome [Desulfuromonadaceae bacterium]|nr:c-type cytochrome [Geobacteraceae bacterium]